ncbi:Bro-N domain-containing protein [Hafnia paralvei]|uniref:BRO-N domain-containing protein n=1 Tax=Hafnia paralvei TaxID=546367 RepID=UPI0039B095E0
MNIVAKSDYNFQGFAFHPVEDSGSIWFTSTELAKALGYKKTDAISQIYARNADEFSESMSLTLNMKVNGINNSLRNKSVRVYSLRGAHLVAMFATTTKAKEFRRWVLDILDREVAQGNVNPAFDFEMHAKNMTVARKHFKFIYEAWCHQLDPALRAINSPVAAELVDHLKSLGSLTYGIHLGLERAEKSKRIH